MREYKFENKILNEIAGLTFHIWKARFYGIFYYIANANLIEDWRQEAYLITIEAYKEGYTPGDRNLLKFIYNRWYRFLVDNWFVKNKTTKPKYIGFGHIHEEKVLDKIKEIYDKTVTEDNKEKISKVIKTIYRINNETFILTNHFIKRWHERLNIKLSPQTIYQQIKQGKIQYRVIKGNQIYERITCPWFTVVINYNKNKPYITRCITVVRS